MKIYFCGSIRGGRDLAHLYKEMIDELKKYGPVLTEHVGDPNLTEHGGDGTNEEIYLRDTSWLRECDIVIAECSQTSIGIGYELAYAEAYYKPVVVFYGKDDDRLSAMISGNPKFTIIYYKTKEELFSKLTDVMSALS